MLVNLLTSIFIQLVVSLRAAFILMEPFILLHALFIAISHIFAPAN